MDEFQTCTLMYSSNIFHFVIRKTKQNKTKQNKTRQIKNTKKKKKKCKNISHMYNIKTTQIALYTIVFNEGKRDILRKEYSLIKRKFFC
jgi:hypothetical protein